MTISSKIGALVDKIAEASQEQAKGIEQISAAAAEMDGVIQQSVANAEESASTAEEMNAQAEQLKGYVEQLAQVMGMSNQETAERNFAPTGSSGTSNPNLMLGYKGSAR